MKPVNFKQFESVYEALRAGEMPKDLAADGTNLLSAEQAGALAEKLNDKLLDGEHLDEGLLDTLKNKFQGLFPFTIVGKAKKILEDYEKAKMHTLQEIGKERLKAFDIRTKAKANPSDELLRSQATEIKERTDKVIETIERAEREKLAAIEKQLQVLARGSKKDRIKLYIDMALAQLKQRVAEAEIKDAKEYTDEEQMQMLQSIVDKREQVAKLYMQKAELAQKLEAKGELKDGPKLPKIGKTIEFKKENGEQADGKWMIVRDVWGGIGDGGKKIDTASHVPVMKLDKNGTLDTDSQGTADEPNKDGPKIWIPVSSIKGFEDFDATVESTIASNEDIKKLNAQIEKLDKEIKAAEAGKYQDKKEEEGEPAPAKAASKQPAAKQPAKKQPAVKAAVKTATVA